MDTPQEQKKKTSPLPLVIVAIVVVAAVAIWMGTRQKSEPEVSPVAEKADELRESRPPASPRPQAGATLADIAAGAQRWMPTLKNWYGKEAPDFLGVDFDGKELALSDFRGKKTLLIFFATWCPPCQAEIPDLIYLRRAFSEEQLAMLAVANEDPEKVKSLAQRAGINYTVLLEKGQMPAPFGVDRIYQTVGLPCSFFINPDGTVKFATAGMVPPTDIIAILNAKK